MHDMVDNQPQVLSHIKMRKSRYKHHIAINQNLIQANIILQARLVGGLGTTHLTDISATSPSERDLTLSSSPACLFFLPWSNRPQTCLTRYLFKRKYSPWQKRPPITTRSTPSQACCKPLLCIPITALVALTTTERNRESVDSLSKDDIP